LNDFERFRDSEIHLRYELMETSLQNNNLNLLKFIIVLIDCFTCYVELFLKHEVSAMATADALWRLTCWITVPLEIVTDIGSQFVNVHEISQDHWGEA